MDAQVGGDVRDRPAALQRQSDPTRNQFIGVLLRTSHEIGGSPFLQGTILDSRVSVNPASLSRLGAASRAAQASRDARP
jgi:hypothetical protein